MLPSTLKFPQLTFPAGETSGRERQRPQLSPDIVQHLAEGVIGKRKENVSLKSVSHSSSLSSTGQTPSSRGGTLLGQQYILRPVGHYLSAQHSPCPLSSPTCIPGSDTQTSKKEPLVTGRLLTSWLPPPTIIKVSHSQLSLSQASDHHSLTVQHPIGTSFP